MNEKVLSILGTLGCILLGVVASAIAWFAGGNALQTNNKEILRKMFNFQLSILILCFVLAFIPVVGQIAGLVIWIANIVVSIQAFVASNNNAAFNAPAFEFIK